jgi:hypothetical protein
LVDSALREESVVNNQHIHTAYNTYLLSKAYKEKHRRKVILKNSEVYGQDKKDDKHTPVPARISLTVTKTTVTMTYTFTYRLE